MQGLGELNELYEQIILDHYRNPRNTDLLESPEADVEANNPFCGDEVRIQLLTDGGRVTSVSVSGRGCAISQSSASLLSSIMQGKTLAELQETVERMRHLMKGEELPDEDLESLGDLEALGGVRKFPVRVKCALLASSALEDALEELERKRQAE
ncbi:MAG: SUF system NifU family Fe-S cluster assembly protein [Dehalococcoidia bacterium]